MRRRAFLACITLLWSTAGVAHAKSVDWMPVWKTAAVQFWGHGVMPSDGEGGTCDDIYFSWITLEGDDFGWLDSPCHIAFSKSMWNENPDPGMRCVAVMHEVGHAYGHGHTAKGIMSPSLNDAPAWFDVKPCKAVMRFGWVATNRTTSIWSEVPR